MKLIITGIRSESVNQCTAIVSCSAQRLMCVFVWQVTWEDGLKMTVDWYLANGFNSYWEHGDVDVALQPHPGAAYIPSSAE